MLFALLMLIVAAQTPSPKPQDAVQPVSAPVATTAPPLAPAPAETVSAETATPEPEPEAEAALPTRQVCRYVEVTGQRFPVRTCRTVTIYPDEGH